MNLSREYIDKQKESGKGSLIFGTPFEELSKEELLAVAIHGWSAYEAKLKEDLCRGHRL